MNKAERRAYQAGLESDMEQQRPAEDPPARRVPMPCPAATGRNHDFSMRSSDGSRRCWYCCKTRAQVEQEAQS